MKRVFFAIEKFLCVLLSILFCVNSFAALVADNDSSAFVTKAEFDLLKKDINEQVKEYENMTDKKVDGAIANYLSYVENKKETVSMPYKNWGKVTGMNYVLESNWKPLDFDFSYNWEHYSKITSSGAPWYQNTWLQTQIKRTRSSTDTQNVLLCEAGEESNTNPDYVIWLGRSMNYVDKLLVSLTQNTNRTVADSAADQSGRYIGTAYYTMYLCYWAKIGTGYFSNLDDSALTIWQPRIWNKSNRSGCPEWYNPLDSTFAKSASTSIELKKVDNKQVEYEHIIHFNNNTGIRLCDPDWKKHLVANPTLTRNNLSYNSESSKWGSWECHSTTTGGTGGNGHVLGKTVDGYYRDVYGTNANTSAIPTIGLIGKSYDSMHIYQSDKKFEHIVDGKSYTSDDKLTLGQGFACFAANKDDEIEWTAIFDETYADGVATNFELNVELAIEPFADGTTVDSSKVIKCENQTNNYLTTTDKKVTFKFKMPESSIVYCKWWPSDATNQGKNWRADLKLDDCGDYTRLKG